MAYITDGAIGVNVDSPASADVFGGSRPPQGTLGETHEGSDGIEWKFIVAGAALVRGSCVAIDQNNKALPLTATTTLLPLQLAFAQTTFSTSQYGYVATRGNNIMILTTGACSAGQVLYTTDTAGQLSTTTSSASQFQVWGVFLSTTVVGTTASANTGVAQFPMIRKPIA